MLDVALGRQFEIRAARQAARVAIRTPDAEVSYGELNRRANQIAHSLLKAAKHSESVATLLESDPTQIAAFLAVLKIGARFVPINPRFPAERIQFVLDDSEATVLLTDAQHLGQAEQLRAGSRALVTLDDVDQAATEDVRVEPFSLETHTWIVYTSGTTGAPKGVLQNHRNLIEYLRVYEDGFKMSGEDRLTTLFSFHVNAGLHDILLSLLTGGCLCPWDLKNNGFEPLANWLISQSSTVLSVVPTAFRQFTGGLDELDTFPALRLVRLWAEPSFRRDFEAFTRCTADNAVLVNRIGSSETGSVSWHFFRKDSVFEGNRLPVGYRTEGHTVTLVDQDGATVRPGEVGEMVVHSRFLSPGYWRRAERTDAAFGDDPEQPGVRWYRTGDLAVELADGCMVPMGRKDHQVKIRGYRVEPDEIEQALVAVPGIEDAVVMSWRSADEDPRLVAYFVAAPGAAPTVTAIRHLIAARLSDYMIPSVFVRLDAFPLAPNGKVARGALPAPPRERPRLDVGYVAPITTEHQRLVDLWQEVLRLDQVGIHDPFLELGGDSLTAIRIVSRVSQHYGRTVPLQTLFEHPTIAAFASQMLGSA